jgi:iron complex outermembrane receptor protein
MSSRGDISTRGQFARGIVTLLVLAAGTARSADTSVGQVSTGTSIRGAPAVGSNLITLSREDIAASGVQTVQQLLRIVPAVTGFGNAAQGAYGSADGSGTFAPTLHGLGASASNGTLILIDGHRLPLTGVNHALADPDVIAPLAIERIELLPEGASSTYGSDGVAGVINVITRRDFHGFEATAQTGIANHYHSYSAGFLWGVQSDTSSVMLSYNFEFRSHLLAGTRSFSRADHTLLDPDAGVDGGGAGDFASNNCSPATVATPAGTFAYPYTGTAVTNANCDFVGLADLLPETRRHNLLIKGVHPVNDSLTLFGDVVWSRQENTAYINRGSVTGIRTWGAGSTVAGPGQINPFFTGRAGGTTETISWQADDLLGSGATNRGGADSLFATLRAEYQLKGDWLLSLRSTVGSNDSRLRRDGALCTSCAILALNGTTQTNGSQTTPSVAGTTTPVLQSLTTANALDVWSPAASNSTSAAVRVQLVDSLRLQQSHQTLKNFSASADGTLLSLPGGPLRAAVGAEYLKITMAEDLLTPRGTGPSSTNSLSFLRDFERDVQSVYAELRLPLINAAHSRRGLRRLDLDLSGRYDKSSDIGSTTSPKFAISWGLTQGITIRGNVGRSFTAPALSSRGDANGINTESAVTVLNSGTAGNGTLTVPSSYPGIAQLQSLNLPGCTASSATCLLGNSSVTGVQLAGGNKDLKAEIGSNFSLGIDFSPRAIPRLLFRATYWSAKYQGAITNPQAGFIAASQSLGAQALTIYPTGATAAQLATATAGMQQIPALPATTYFILSTQQRNALYLSAAGVDAEVRYALDTRLGDFSTGLAVSRRVKLDQKFGADGVTFSTLNTVGINGAFPSNRLAARVDMGWKRRAWKADLGVNYEGFYRNWSATAGTGIASWNVIRVAGLYPIGGGEPIESYTTLDLHASYDFASMRAKGLTISLDATNLFDNRPPFFNTTVGYDVLNASPIDRQLSIGVNRKW